MTSRKKENTGGWYAWHVDGFGIEESDQRAEVAEEAGEEVKIVYVE